MLCNIKQKVKKRAWQNNLAKAYFQNHSVNMEEFYNQVYHFAPDSNYTANSIIIYNLILQWGHHILKSQRWPKSEDKFDVDRAKILVDLDDFSAHELIFEGEKDEDQMPNSSGILQFNWNEVNEHCVRGVCEKSIAAINGTFKNGKLEVKYDIYRISVKPGLNIHVFLYLLVFQA